jgi:cell division transport system ATP-binding protein
VIELNYLCKRYRDPGGGERDALRNVSFRVAAGEMVFLTGHSGAGKSTLLKLLALIERPSHGEARVGGRNLARLPFWRIPHYRRALGVVFQDHKLLEDRTVYDNVALPLVVCGAPARDIPRRVRAALEAVGLLDQERRYPPALSAGEQQRLGIARAVVNRPPLLLADEPTGNLDPELSDQIMDLFHDLNRHGLTVLIATHDRRHIERLGARRLVLKNGELAQDSAA